MNIREVALVSALQAVIDIAQGEEHPKLVSIAAFARRVLEGPGAMVEEAAPVPEPSPQPHEPQKGGRKLAASTIRWHRMQGKRRAQANATGVGEALVPTVGQALVSVGGQRVASSSLSGSSSSVTAENANASADVSTGALACEPADTNANASTNAEPLALVHTTNANANAPTRARKEPSGDHQRVIAAFFEEYERLRGCKPSLGGKELAGAKALLAACSNGDEAIQVVRRAFADPFVAKNHPSLAYIASNVNAYRGKEPPSGVQRRAPAVQPPPANGQRIWKAGDGQ